MFRFARSLVPMLLSLFLFACHGKESTVQKTEDIKKQEIRVFWETFNRATSLRTAGKFEDAAKAYESALQLDSKHEESLYYLGSSLLELGEYEKAIQIYRRMVKLNPKSNRGLSQLGLLLSTPAPGAVLNEEEARGMFERVTRVNQEESGPFLRMGLLSLRQGDRKSAWKYFQIAAGFKSPEGLFFSGYLRFQEGNYVEAASLFQRVLEINRNEKQITGRGVFSEGDIKTSGSSLSLMEKAGVKALIFLHWTSLKLGRYPDSVPAEFRVTGNPAPVAVNLAKQPGPGRVVWCDLDSDSVPEMVLIESGRTCIFENASGKFREFAARLAGGYDGACADYNGDHRPDLYIISNGFTGEGQNTLYRNEGSGAFQDVTDSSGLSGRRATAAAAFADMDGDSDPDLLEAGNAAAGNAPLRIYWNKAGKFQLEQLAFPGNAVSFSIADYNQDGAPDLFVLRWKRPAVMFRNDGKGRLTDVTSSAGLQSAGGNSFSASFFDYNHDPWPDLFVSRHASYETALLRLIQPGLPQLQEAPQLYVNVGGKTFGDAGKEAKLQHAYGTMKSIAVDWDRDGWTDIVLANGGLDSWRLEPSVVLRNLEGKGFVEWAQFPANQAANILSFSIAEGKSDGVPRLFAESL